MRPAALVERFGDHAVDAEIAEPGQEQNEGQRHPDFRFEEHAHRVL